MTRWSITSLVAAALVLTLPLPVRAMIGGSPDGGGHPNVGAIDIRLAGQPIVASGVLISPTVFLTAGHVTRFFDLVGQTRARVTFDPEVTPSSTWYWGTVHTDPAFRVEESFADFHDLGVVVFDAPIPGVVPALLPEVDFLEHLAG